MKKILYLLFTAAVVMTSCGKQEPESTDKKDPVKQEPEKEEVVEATVSVSPETITLGGSKFDTAEASVKSNQSVLDAESNDSWMKVTLTGKILTVTAAEANETGADRTGTVTVTAGEGYNTASAVLTVVQSVRDAGTEVPVLQVAASTVDLNPEADSKAELTFDTNQTEVSLTLAEECPWLSYVIEDGTVIFTALGSNYTGAIRSVDATLTAGTGENAATAPVVIRQLTGAPTGIALGALYEGGMIFEVAADYIKIVSIKEGNCFWSEIPETYIGTLENPDEGKENTELIKANEAFTGNFPAAEWCVAYGEGWYMPSRREINSLISNLKLNSLAGQEAAQSFLASYGGDPLDLSSQYYWTCCEKSNSVNVWCVRLNDTAHGNFKKKGDAGRPVRAVKKIEMDVASMKDQMEGSLGDFPVTEVEW